MPIMMCLFFLIVIMSVCACQGTSKIVHEVEEDILTPIPNNRMYIANLDSNECQKQLNLSSFFSKVSYIPLETTKNSLLGRVNQLYIKGDTIFVLDATLAKTLQLFRKDGKYLGKLGQQGNGPGEYKNPTDFGICDSLLYLFDAANQRISYYRLPSLQFKESCAVSSSKSAISRYVAIDSSKLYTDIYLPNRICPYLIQEINLQDASTLNWLSTNMQNKGYLNHAYFTGQSFFHKTLYGIRYNQQMMDTVMTIDNGKISPYLAIQYTNSPTYEDVSKADTGDGVEAAMVRLRGVFNISDYVEWENGILFHFQKGAFRQVGIIDKKTGLFQWADRLNFDLTFFLDQKCPIKPVPIFGEGGKLYAYIHPMEMESFLSMVGQKETRLSADELRIMKKLSLDSNPILLCYEE